MSQRGLFYSTRFDMRIIPQVEGISQPNATVCKQSQVSLSYLGSISYFNLVVNMIAFMD